MTKAPDGRFCRSCTRVVIDFTKMSDRELLNYFKTHSGKICGSFRQSQLDRELVPEPWRPRISGKAAAALIAGGLLAAGSADAQVSLFDKSETQQTHLIESQSFSVLSQDSRQKAGEHISGIVVRPLRASR